MAPIGLESFKAVSSSNGFLEPVHFSAGRWPESIRNEFTYEPNSKSNEKSVNAGCHSQSIASSIDTRHFILFFQTF